MCEDRNAINVDLELASLIERTAGGRLSRVAARDARFAAIPVHESAPAIAVNHQRSQAGMSLYRPSSRCFEQRGTRPKGARDPDIKLDAARPTR